MKCCMCLLKLLSAVGTITCFVQEVDVCEHLSIFSGQSLENSKRHLVTWAGWQLVLHMDKQTCEYQAFAHLVSATFGKGSAYLVWPWCVPRCCCIHCRQYLIFRHESLRQLVIRGKVKIKSKFSTILHHLHLYLPQTEHKRYWLWVIGYQLWVMGHGSWVIDHNQTPEISQSKAQPFSFAQLWVYDPRPMTHDPQSIKYEAIWKLKIFCNSVSVRQGPLYVLCFSYTSPLLLSFMSTT